MRQSLFALFLLAALPVAYGQAESFGLYNPATGDVVINGLRGQLSATLHSTTGQLSSGILALAPVISPANAQVPLVHFGRYISPRYWIVWSMPTNPGTNTTPPTCFGFDSIFLDSAVPPGTPTIDLTLVIFDGSSNQAYKLSQVPEPATLRMGCFALIGVAALRHRK